MVSKSLFEKVKEIHDQIETDVLGGSPIEKCFLMAWLIERLELKTFVEIGVYRGKSFFSVAPAVVGLHGKCYGIDPWKKENLKENDLHEELKRIVDAKADELDFDKLYQEVIERKKAFGFFDEVMMVRDTAEDAAGKIKDMLKADREEIGLLHIDGNHDYEYVKKDADIYIPLVKEGGIIVFDDTDWEGVRRVYEEEKKKHVVLYEGAGYAILMKNAELVRLLAQNEYIPLEASLSRVLSMQIPAILENVHAVMEKYPRTPKIFVGIMTYNSSEYIEECLRSIMKQEGDFQVEIGVFDDASPDNTVEIVEGIKDIPAHVHLTIHTKEKNEGYEKNYVRIFDAFENSDCDLLTNIDGDDYLKEPYRFQRHLDEMKRHPECALSFNRLVYYYQQRDAFELWDYQNILTKEVYSVFDLAEYYFIGNGSCSMIRRNAAAGISRELFTEAKIGDWLTHCTYAQKGDVLHISEPMNVYRKHEGGVWSGTGEQIRREKLACSVREYNKQTNYLLYEKTYSYLTSIYSDIGMDDKEQKDLVIVDDVFPHPVSGFRLEEYNEYLSHYDNMQIFVNGASAVALGKRSHQSILSEYKQINPRNADRLIETLHPYYRRIERLVKSRLLYFCFLGNAFTSIDFVEKNKIPFVFELYPGGSFFLDRKDSDEMLKRVMSSPYFRKVIVTQDITRDYLLKKKFCRKDQIEEIFGVVIPKTTLLDTVPQINQGDDNSVLKVCFAAMKYTSDGKDKGYDVFVDVVKKLAPRNKLIEFHVAGTFDKHVIPLGEYEDRVQFHGVMPNVELKKWLSEMDIIVSPNLNNIIAKGAFDGFPTATCTDAGLCGTLIMCTDPLGLNHGRFKEGKEIEIIHRDPEEIAERILYYFQNRQALRDIIGQQYKRIRELYDVDIQIGERIRILDAEIAKYEKNIVRAENLIRIREKVEAWMKILREIKCFVRRLIKKVLKTMIRLLKKPIKALIKLCPEVLKRELRPSFKRFKQQLREKSIL